MGKPKGIKSPEIMFDLFTLYQTKVKNNPRLVSEFHGRDGEERRKPLEVPLTMEGFENYVFSQGLNTELAHYFSNREGRYSDYVTICSRIRSIIRQDQIEGGMVGQYNPSITQRLNGLKEQTEVTSNNVSILSIDPLAGD